MTLTPEEEQAKVDAQKKIHEAVITGKGLELLPPDVRRTVDNAEFQSLLVSDPVKLVPIRRPLLIVQGELDTQVEPQNADRLGELARKRKERARRRRLQGAPASITCSLPATTEAKVGEYGTLADKHVSESVAGDRDVAEEDARPRAKISPAATCRVARRPSVSGHAPRTARPARPPAPRATDRSHRRHLTRSRRGVAEPGLVTTTGPRYFRIRHGRRRSRRRSPRNGCPAVSRSAGETPRPLPAAAARRGSSERLADRSYRAAGRPAASASSTGCHMANFTALAGRVFRAFCAAPSWDVEADGLLGAPRLHVIVGDEVHVSVIGCCGCWDSDRGRSCALQLRSGPNAARCASRRHCPAVFQCGAGLPALE